MGPQTKLGKEKVNTENKKNHRNQHGCQLVCFVPRLPLTYFQDGFHYVDFKLTDPLTQKI